jgi:hypothetical protein
MNPDENLEEYTAFFRKHYIFWLDDESGPPAASTLKSAFKVTALFHASFARGIYSSLQVLDAIKSGRFPSFDLAFIDVRLAGSDQYFTKVAEIKDTAPPPIGDSSVYTDDKAELNRIEEFSGPDKFGFDLAKVKSQAGESGGLFVWAWAMRICSEAKYIIYSASDDAKAKMEFLRIAGILDICNKGDLFHITNPEEYIVETVDKWFKVYASAFGNFREGVTKVTYTPLLHDPREGEKLVENCVVRRDRNFVSPIYFGSQQRRKHPDSAFIIHHVASRDEGREWRLTYERYGEFRDRGGVFSRPYVIDTLVKLIGRKIERYEIDRNVTDLVLNLKDTSQTWAVELGGAGGRRWEGVPLHLLPLGGEYDLSSRTVMLKNREEARDTYLFASFFLPWANALIGSDGKKASDALSAIRSQFGQQFKNGCELMRLLCGGAPFNDFIEASAERMPRELAAKALERYDVVGAGKVLSAETARLIKEYLNSDPPYRDWKAVKGMVELTYESLRAHFEDWVRYQDADWLIEIMPERGDREWNSGKWYADVRWIKTALDTILNNVTTDKAKAFDLSKNFEGTPSVMISIVKASSPARLIITVADNGVGCDVDALMASASGGYDRLLDGEGAHLLRAYGDLTISSGGREAHLGSGQGASDNPDSSPAEGTSVTLSILLG